MKYLSILFLLFLLPFYSRSQESRSEIEEKMEANKVAWLTTKLDLNPDEAKVFWPIYNDLVREQRALRSERFQKMISFRKIKEIDDLSDSEIQTLILNDFDFKQRDLDIEKKYYNRFKSRLSSKIVGKFYRAQESYKKELLKQYRRGPQP